MRQPKSFAAFLLLASTLVFTTLASAQADQRDEAAIHDYVLTMPRVQAFAAASKAAQALGDNNSFAAECAKKLDDDKLALVDKIHLVESSCPKMNNWIKEHGMTAREFFLIPMSLITAGFAQVAIEQGGKPPAFINPANVQFLKQHKSELDGMDLMGDHKDHEADKPAKSNDDENN